MNRSGIVNVIPSMQTMRRWEKRREQYLISPVGRWGRKWPGLQTLVFRMAVNLGMVSNHREAFDSVEVVRLDINETEVRSKVLAAAEPYLDMDMDPNDLICIMGPENFADTARKWTQAEMVMASHPYRVEMQVSERGQYPRQTKAVLLDIPVVVSPYVKGLVVLPRSHFQ